MVRSFNGGKTVFLKTVLGELDIHMPRNEAHFNSVTQSCLTLWTAARQTFLFITNSQSLLKLMSIELVMPSNHLILCWSHLLPSSIFPSIRVFSGTLKGLLQHHSSKASILWYPAFFIVQLSHLYMTNGKTIALTRWTSVGKVMSLLFNMLSRLVITFTKEQASFNFMAAVTMQGFWGPKYRVSLYPHLFAMK